jgi:hypothetical protein
MKGGEPMADQRGTTTLPKSEPSEAETGSTDQEQLAADLQHLRALLEADRVAEARRFVKELEQRWPKAERVQHYARVLQPPKVRMRPDLPARSREREWKWLEEHGREYPGCWLAIYGDQLIAADPDRRTVMAEAEQALGEETYLIFHQPGSPQAE